MRWMQGLGLAVAMAMSGNAAMAGDVRAARTLRVGTIVEATDLRTTDGAETGAVGALVGLEVRRVVFAGLPVTSEDLGPPTLVRRNQPVRMVFRMAGMLIRTDGRALGSGGLGEMIEVVNAASRQTVRGIIVAPGAVEVRR